MTQPTPYTRSYSFTNSFAAAPTQVFPGSSLDAELNNAKITLDQILQNLILLQNDDGSVLNGSIGPAQLSSALTVGITAPTVWAAAKSYSASPPSTILHGNNFYTCVQSHISSSSFSADLSAGKWILALSLTSIPGPASSVTIVPLGGISATDVQDAMYALDTRISTNATNIATNTSAIASNVTSLATQAAAIATNTTNIATNTTNIATNTSGIAANVTSLATQAAEIAANTASIVTNSANIATNTTNIAANTASIATNATAIAAAATAIATGAIVGTATNNNATAGNIGEYVSSSVVVGSAVSLTSGTPANVTSISLTAGDWDVRGVVGFAPNVLTVESVVTGSIGTTTGSVGTAPNGGAFVQINMSLTGSGRVLPVGTARLSLASTTTVYLVASATFTTSTDAAYGFLGARRVR